ncbi:MAG: hypothetical protein HOW97_02575 [Catenulispora sp.]|nr:hypothetical protein [Catenulispora sp.]
MAASQCPRPEKHRYATRHGAETAAYRAQIGVGQILNPYLCQGCGWWHLSKKAADTVPAGAVADPAVVERLVALDDIAFRALAGDEARGQVAMPERIALRSPRLVARWRRALGLIIQDVDTQLSMRRGEKNTDWGRRILAFKTVLDARRAEAGEVLASTEGAAQAEQARLGVERARARQEALAAKKSAAELRALAGDAAIKRLIDAHGLEFSRYLAEECARLGTPLPARVAKYLDQEGEAA